MKKTGDIKVLIISFIAFVIVTMCSFIAFKNIYPEKKVVHISASIAPLKGSVRDNFKNCDAALIGRVTGANPHSDNGIVFTDYTLEVTKSFRSKFETKDMKVTLLGGELNGVEYVSEINKQLQIGDTYLFFLNKRYPDDANSPQYCPAYAGAGIIKVNGSDMKDKKIYIADEFDSKKGFENTIKGKNIEEVLSNELK